MHRKSFNEKIGMHMQHTAHRSFASLVWNWRIHFFQFKSQRKRLISTESKNFCRKFNWNALSPFEKKNVLMFCHNESFVSLAVDDYMQKEYENFLVSFCLSCGHKCFDTNAINQILHSGAVVSCSFSQRILTVFTTSNSETQRIFIAQMFHL